MDDRSYREGHPPYCTCLECLEKNNNLEAEDAFKNAMKIKMSDAIDLKKREVASSIVTKTNKSEEDNAQETE